MLKIYWLAPLKMALAGREGCRQWEDLKLANVTTTPSIILASNSGSISGHFLTVTVMIVYQINITGNKKKNTTLIPRTWIYGDILFLCYCSSILSVQQLQESPLLWLPTKHTYNSIAGVPKSTVLSVGVYLPGKVLSVIPSSIIHQLSK